MWRKDLLAAETFYHEKGEGWTLPWEGSSEACGHLLNELLHTIFQPCGFMVVAEEFTACFCVTRMPTVQGQLWEKDQKKLVPSVTQLTEI